MRSLIPSMALAIALTTPAVADDQVALKQTKAFFTALESGTMEEIASFLDEGIVTTLPFAASGETGPEAFRVYDGREQVMAYIGGARERIAELAFVDNKITVSNDGDTVYVENSGNMVLADGREYKNLYVFRLDYSDGQIASITEYFNPVTAAIAFGRPIGPQVTQ